MTLKKFAIFFLASLFTHVTLLLATEETMMTPDKALKQLIEGNQRYSSDKLLHPNRSQIRRESLVAKQKPFAIILGCSDSRVSPEVLFDQGLGDLFIVRTAGNVAGPLELETIKFGALVLGASLILVLGHENCGAVEAVMTDNAAIIPQIAEKIRPAIKQYVGRQPFQSLGNAVKANVNAIVKQLKDDKSIASLIQDKKIDVKGGYYHLTSGEVEILH